MKISLIGAAVGLLGSVVVASAQVGPNIDELAKELSNPGAANATLNFKFEYRTFKGALPGADDQNSLTATFQPVFPFVLGNGNNLIFRPAIPYVFGQPVFGAGAFNDQSQFGDLPYDLLYSWNSNGWTLGAGFVGAVPTGSSISADNWLLGPSFLAVKPTDWGIWGLFPFHNEKVGGSGADISVTSLQYFLFFSLGEGWQIGTGPTLTYDWNADSDQSWTIPFGLQVAKTTVIGNQLVKLNAGIEKNVVTPDAFASDWKFTFTFSPVIKNPFQPNPPTPVVDAVTRTAVLSPIRN
jgi:hypothetical protein